MAKHDPNRLYPSGDGRFCKRIRGTLHHFGGDGNYELALREFLAVKDALFAGRKVRREAEVRPGALTVKTVVNAFLNAWQERADSGRIKAGTFDDYSHALVDFTDAVGDGRDPADLRPDDFEHLRKAWGERMGPYALDRNVQAVRTMFRWAERVARMMDRQPWYGDAFGKSSEGDKRRAARDREREHGARMFTADELKIILADAGVPMKAMVLLALNGGMYAIDIARLRLGDVRKEGSAWVVDIDRGKTDGVPWKFPLWPETRKAIDASMACRPTPRDAAHADLLFLTVRGNPWHAEHVHRGGGGSISTVTETHAIGQELDKILEAERRRGKKVVTLKRRGVGFGSLRHTHVSAVGDHPDLFAARRVRGHKIESIESHYDKIPLARLLAVTDLARSRLIETKSTAPGRKAR